jgi:hypothetical protein
LLSLFIRRQDWLRWTVRFASNFTVGLPASAPQAQIRKKPRGRL